MGEFSINYVSKSKLADKGVSVAEVLELLNLENELDRTLLKALNVESLKNDFIAIPGASKLIEIQKGINKGFDKVDLRSALNDIKVNVNEDGLTFSFTKLDENEYFLQKKLSSIDAIPIYSSKTDFFSWLYGMGKYANELIKNNLFDILRSNLESLRKEDIGSKRRNYRILYNSNNRQLYVRAITSLDRYNDYNNNITIVIALLSLHRKMKESRIFYSLNRIEYNESHLRIFFEEQKKQELGRLGFVKNVIEISNDEIKRESLRFEAIGNIEFIDPEKNVQEIIIQPSCSKRPKVKTNILAISHSLSPIKFIQGLEGIDKSTKIHNELFELINEVSQITDPSQIMFLVKNKIQKAKDESFKKHKNQIEKIINTHVVNNMIQLLTLFKKMELVTENDIEASEYIRYIIYESLIERR